MLLEEKVELFLNELESAQDILVLYHLDMDGTISASILYKKIKSKNVKFVASPLSIEKVFNEKKAKNYDLIIFLDLATSYEFLKSIENCFIIDHHPTNFYENSRVINSLYDFNDKCFPTSLIISKIFNKYYDIALLGIYGDSCFEKFNEIIKENKINEKKVLETFSRLNSIIVTRGRSGAMLVFDIVKNVDSIDELYEYSYRFVKYKKILDKEIKKNESNVKIVNNCVFCDISSDFPLFLSEFSNYLMKKYKDKKIIVVYNSNKNPVPISIRVNDESLNLLDLLEKIKERIYIEYGGHEKALGIKVNSIKDLDFLLEILSKL